MPVGYSLEPPVSEEPFLRRELGLAWTQVDEAELVRRLRERPTAIICSEPEAYEPVLAEVPAGSATLVLISDEGYSPQRRYLAQHPAVRSVYRQYAARPATTVQVARAAAGFAGDARGTSQASRTALPNGIKGRQTRRLMQAWDTVTAPVHDVPLGYTATFEEAFARSTPGDLAADASLFTRPRDGGERPVSITFRGNRGLAARIVGMERAARIPDSDIGTIDADWSGFAPGDVGASYVQALESSRFALCPPGFVNNESFRYYEALLCGALPVELAVALTHQGIATARSPRALVRTSWRRGLAEAQAMPEDERAAAVVAARTLVADTLAGLRARLAEDVEG